MEEFSPLLHNVLIGCMIFLAFCMLGCFIRAIKGTRFTDRVVAINLIGTITVIFICLLSALLKAHYLLDVALVYTLLSFLAVVVLCRIVTLHHRGRLRNKEREEKKDD